MKTTTATRYISTLLLAVLLCALAGCSRSVTGLQCSLDEGWLISDDVYFTNSSGQELTEVRVTMTLTGENGAQRSIQKYWATWHLGDKQHIAISVDNSVPKIQRVDLSGSSDQGSISQSWVKR
jgi:hypothetical protein